MVSVLVESARRERPYGHPILYVYMKRRRFEDYKNVFTTFQEQTGVKIQFHHVYVDMEAALLKFIKQWCPRAEIHVCLVHLYRQRFTF